MVASGSYYLGSRSGHASVENTRIIDLDKNSRFKSIENMTRVVVILTGIWAAYLSYTYNVSVGTATVPTIFYMILAYLFSILYIFYYYLVLKVMGGKKGGGRR
jgi:hypothetical protein